MYLYMPCMLHDCLMSRPGVCLQPRDSRDCREVWFSMYTRPMSISFLLPYWEEVPVSFEVSVESTSCSEH